MRTTSIRPSRSLAGRWPALAIACIALAAIAVGAPGHASAQATAGHELQGDGGVSDFYRWSEPLKGAPGRLLRTEPLPDALALDNAARSVRILYSSTDGLDGQTRIVVSGALFIPKGAAPKGGWPLLAWAHGTVGVADVCAPSWAGRSQRDKTYLNFWLAQGYAVVASDYQGLGTIGAHPYLATRPEAYSVLDSVRAVQKGDFGLARKVVLIGQSQGGGAAFATAGYTRTYAPELDVRGTVATGTPYFSPEAQLALAAARPKEMVDPLLGYTFYAMSTLEQIDPGFRIEDYLTDAGLPVARLAATACFPQMAKTIIDQGLTYNRAFKADPTSHLKNAYDLMGYPTLAIPKPVFMGTGGKDRDVPAPMQLSLGADACKAGAVIEQHLYPALDHSGTVNGSSGDSSIFVRKAFAGEPIAGNCSARPTLAAAGP